MKVTGRHIMTPEHESELIAGRLARLSTMTDRQVAMHMAWIAGYDGELFDRVAETWDKKTESNGVMNESHMPQEMPLRRFRINIVRHRDTEIDKDHRFDECGITFYARSIQEAEDTGQYVLQMLGLADYAEVDNIYPMGE